jgi:hypothetical protein
MPLRFSNVADTCRDILFGTRNFSFVARVFILSAPYNYLPSPRC